MVRVLGATEFTVGTRRIGMGTEALFALGLYLTTRAGDRVSREDVLDTFWPGGDEDARRHAMRQMLYRLRQKGMAFLEDGDILTLDPAKVDSDLRHCLAAGWPESATAQEVEGALTFGPTFSSRLPRAFLDWCDGIRSEVSHQARKAAMQLIASARSQGRWADLDRWAKAVLQTDPLHEEATLARAEAASMSGAKTLALEILDGYLAEVGTGDGSVGKPALQLRKRIAERRASWVPTGPREVPLVGREEEMSALTQAVESALLGRSRSVLLVGPSGYGKSRLLAEAREYAALRGVRCVAVRAEATLASHPWAAVRDLCRLLVELPGAAAIDPRAMSVVRSMLREDAVQEGDMSFGPATTAEDIRASLVALTNAISHETPLLVTLDDLQNADPRSVATMYSLLIDVQSGRCSCLAATHPAAHHLTERSDGRRGSQIVRLTPLKAQASRQLAASTANAHGNALSDKVLDHLARRSGGHPLFARELALSFARGEPLDSLPATLADVVARNLSTQSPDAVRVLRVVALLSSAATVGRVQSASRQDRRVFLSLVDSLSQEGILHLDPSRVLRLHDSWRDSILSGTPETVSATLALECAGVLEAEEDADAVTTHGCLADLYRVAGDINRATHFRLRSIDSLISAGLYESALNSLQGSSSAGFSPAVRARFRVREAVVLLATGNPVRSLELANDVWRSRVLQAGALISEHVLAVGVSADCHIKLDAADKAPFDELLALANSGKLSPGDTTRACLWGLRLASNAADSAALRKFIEVVRNTTRSAGPSPASALSELIFAAELGSAVDIATAYDQVRSMDKAGLSVSDQCLLLRCSAHALRVGGFIDEASATGEASFRLAQEHGMKHAARLSLELLCNMHLDFANTVEASRWLELLAELTASGGHGNTQTSFEHVRDRLNFSRGLTSAATSDSLGRLDLVKTFGKTHGRAGELALAAAAAAGRGDNEAAAALMKEALDGAVSFLGRPVADFILDTCLETGRLIGRESRADEVAAEHLSARSSRGEIPIAPAFRNLRSLADPSTRA
ncbi:AAA family ATPase [Pseudogemmatithrix spongiicola]|uniref:AAA family ATPase n=1 Tax=Pseudogemmatithrix spongiicola TaxID=3062599 RepID=A0AA49JW03_9BACT|nr:AAA family ATPase [Gemmatimonadaceae bacterium 'strain 138']WKW15917.1 AAA family ATPase [Gemmatimonadaceae bacterium 'strain 318']